MRQIASGFLVTLGIVMLLVRCGGNPEVVRRPACTYDATAPDASAQAVLEKLVALVEQVQAEAEDFAPSEVTLPDCTDELCALPDAGED